MFNSWASTAFFILHMLTNTDSYARLKAQVQHSLNFVVLVCHAIPALKGYIKAVEKGHEDASKLPTTDYFGKTLPHAELKAFAVHYKQTLGRFTLLSSFAYFESYCKSVVEEAIGFHGGVTRFENRRAHSVELSTELAAKKRKLQEPRKQGKAAKYKRVGNELRVAGYAFPSELFAAFGASAMANASSNLRAHQIPEFLQNALGVVLSQDERDDLDRIRNLRNNIAHGNPGVVVDLSEALKENDILRRLAGKIDRQIIDTFFVIEEH